MLRPWIGSSKQQRCIDHHEHRSTIMYQCSCDGIEYSEKGKNDCNKINYKRAVKSSKSEPICIISAASPAAKNSLVITDAISARDTSKSALISCSLIKAIAALTIIGIPHSTIATQAMSNGSSVFNHPPRDKIKTMNVSAVLQAIPL